jgi:hypothetical protein
MEATMTICDRQPTAVGLLYQEKQARGLVDVKFLHKNLDEGSPAQVAADLQRIHESIKSGHARPLDFGDMRFKRAAH